MSEITRSNKDEFISYLGTCMSFYKMHLTPGEQSQVIQDIAEMLYSAMTSEEKKNIVKALYPGYEITISAKL